MIETLESRKYLSAITPLYGDANLDGKVDGSDYSRIDNGYLNHLTGWTNGDFNHDGVVNGSDYTLMDNTFNTGIHPKSFDYNGDGTDFNALPFSSAILDESGFPEWSLDSDGITAPVSGYILKPNNGPISALCYFPDWNPDPDTPITQITSQSDEILITSPDQKITSLAVTLYEPSDTILKYQVTTTDRTDQLIAIPVQEGLYEVQVSQQDGVISLDLSQDSDLAIVDVGSKFTIR